MLKSSGSFKNADAWIPAPEIFIYLAWSEIDLKEYLEEIGYTEESNNGTGKEEQNIKVYF